MSIFNNNLLAGAAAQSTTTPVHTIDQSIRFNALDNPYMSKAFSSKGSPKKFTLSWWTKLGERTTSATSESQMFFIAYHSGGYQTDFSIQSAARAGGVAHTFRTYSVTTGGGAVWNFTTTQLFRDPSAWYNFVVVSDTDNAVQAERFRLYINGQRVTDFSTATYPSSGVEPVWNNSTSVTHYVGSRAGNVNTRFDGYMAEMVHIDGQALDPSSFGEYNSSNIWIPKDVSGLTFGTNGFHIDGRDSADLGDDESGNGNDFTTSGLTAHDQVADSPTNNFAVLNPLDERGSGTLSDGNLQMAFGATNDNVTATQGLNTGKWYWEVYIVDKDDPYVGVQDSGVASTGYTEDAVALWVDGGYIYEDGSDTGDRSTTYANGDIVGVAFDVDNKKIWWSKNGQWYSADDSSTATINISEVEAGNQAQVITRSPDFFMPFVGNYNTGTVIMNFGQEGTFAGNLTAGGNSDGNAIGNFKYSVPSGYLALCTKNLGS